MNLNLNLGEFEDNLIKKRSIFDGVQYLFRFPNDYGASVVKHWSSYGHDRDLWELAVLVFDDDMWDLTYDTEITDDVEGYLTDQDVLELLGRIRDLK